ncbi:MAG: hypothetical protein QW101_00560 [Ignisphaera sp.]
MEEVDSYSKEHAVRVCREKCVEVSVYVEELDLCVKECVRSIVGGKHSN